MKLSKETKQLIRKEYEEFKQNSEYYEQLFEDYVDEYVAFVKSFPFSSSVPMFI